MQFFSDDYLVHHGILGQKWGVRRYQNKDGSLTELGKRRVGKMSEADRQYGIHNEIAADYGNVSGGLKNSSKAANNASEIASKMASIRKNREKSKMDVSQMSDQELREKINRMGLERQYKDLLTSQETSGYDYVRDILSIGGSGLAAASSIMGILLAINKLKGK